MRALLLAIILIASLRPFAQDEKIQRVARGCTECDEVCNDKSQYIRIYSENDFWKLHGITDRYFTNGIKIDYFFLPKGTEKGLLDKLFFNLPYKRNDQPNATRNNNFALSFGMNQYTPINIISSRVDSSDRPYAGWIFLAAKCISNDFGTAERLSTEYSIGVIGPAAGQRQVQTKWHEIFDFAKPGGWDNQIADDLAININMIYEKGLINPIPNLELMGNFEANIGTVTNYFGVGSTLRIGLFNDYFLNEFGLRHGKEKIERYKKCTDRNRRNYHNENLDRKLQIYTLIKPALRIVVNNSLLQGGVFSHARSPYVLSADQLERFYVQGEFGLNIVYGGVGVTFSQLFRTAEFKNSFDSQWGALTLTFRVR